MDTLQHLRELHEAARLKAETAELEATVKALDTASRVVESEWGNPVDTREYFNDSPGFGNVFNNRATSAYDRNRGQFSPFFESEADLAQIRGIARFCASSYETGINALENLVSFVLGKGFVYKAISRGESDAPDALLKAVDKAIEEFHEANKWEGDLETEIVIRSDRDGECFAWMRDDGGPMVTLIEPDYITEPADCCKLNDLIECHDADWFLGVGASPMHLDNAKGYFAQWPSNRVGMIPHTRMVHIKCNVDRMIKRGLSSFYPVWQTLEKAAKLTDSTIHGSTIQSRIALIKKHMAGTSRDAIESGRTSRTVATSSYNTPSRYKTDSYEDWSRGGKIIGTAGFDYMYGPLGQSGAPAFMDVVGAAMRIVGSRWQMPEYMISGDASNANYASTLVSGGPFERATSRRQAFYRRHCLAIHWQALDVWCKAGRFRKLGINSLGELKSVIDIQVDCEPSSVNDPQVQHTINKDLQTAGVMSKATFADRNGLDYAAEQEKIEKEPKPEVMPGMPGQTNPIAGNPADGDKDGLFPESRLAEAAKLIWGDYAGGKPLRESAAIAKRPKDGDGDGLVNDGKANETAVGDKESSGPETISMPDGFELKAYRNPSRSVAKRWLANNKYGEIRGIRSPDGNVWIWNAEASDHKNVSDALGFDWANDTIKHNGRILIKSAGHLDIIYDRIEAKTWLESLDSQAIGLVLRESTEPKDGDGDGFIDDGKPTERTAGAKQSSKKKVTDTPEFKAWFGDSKVVDEHGQPLVLYHGTNASFDEFKPDIGKEYGIYLTPKKKYAEQYGKTTKQVHVALKNPLIVENKGDISSRDITKADVDKLIAKGYDGIVSVGRTPKYKDEYPPTGAFRPISQADEIVAFRPSQIKSAS
jgi:hypothetical protein